ncbi:MAG: hypothetical protein H8F28_22720, partial [Fibrella sp.]|nr:hypothetical protein [Armatimonadota bacterium]
MKRLVIIIVGILALFTICVSVTLASYIGLPLNELTAQSDVIARVRVLSIRANPHRKHVAQHALPYDAGELYQIANVEVVEGFYGARNGERLVIYFNNGAACPNVWYRQGEERVVFLG